MSEPKVDLFWIKGGLVVLAIEASIASFWLGSIARSLKQLVQLLGGTP